MSRIQGVLFQFFHWYNTHDEKLWLKLASDAKYLSDIGVSAVWIPPAGKAAGGNADAGYGVYDHYDLGEFDQKGSVETKYGSKDDLIKAISKLHENNIQVYADIVFNHLMGADEEQEFDAIPLSYDDRSTPLGDLQPVKGWTKFTYPGRAGKYSDHIFHADHFKAVDANSYDPDSSCIYLMKGKDFESDVDSEKGNFDFLMGCDLDTRNPEVREILLNWGIWFVEETKVDGFRFDAIKHVSADLFNFWLDEISKKFDKKFYCVGEYWHGDVQALTNYIDVTSGKIELFDVPLHLNFHRASKEGASFDLTKIFEGSLVSVNPTFAVTFVENHDTQPLQSLESPVEPWFKLHAYSIILLRNEGYPCVFYPDLYGSIYTGKGGDGNDHEIFLDSLKPQLEELLKLRKDFVFGEKHDYFDDHCCIAWLMKSTDSADKCFVVIMNNGGEQTSKQIQTGISNGRFRDILKSCEGEIVTDDEGKADFYCNKAGVSVWVPVTN